MPLTTIDFPRKPLDMSHFVMSTGRIGGLKVLSWSHVLAGDSYESDIQGAMRLSPLRRGLSVDMKSDICTFYVPFRHIWGNDMWSAFVRHAGGMGTLPDGQTGALSPTRANTSNTGGSGSDAMFLGTRTASDGTVPFFLFRAYEMIYRDYFLHPSCRDTYKFHNHINELPSHLFADGYQCYHLPSTWTDTIAKDDVANSLSALDKDFSGMKVSGLNTAASQIHVAQERHFFERRYRDIIQGMGGSASPDSDFRPRMLMHSEFWASGHDVNGTDQTSLGSFSGRVQQAFEHRVPRFYVPEHGVIMTVVVNRFPTICEAEHPYIVSAPATYADYVADPNVFGSDPSLVGVDVSESQLMYGGRTNVAVRVPAGHLHRTRPSHVDFRYNVLEGFPFLRTSNPFAVSTEEHGRIDFAAYDPIFGSMQLGHWNLQARNNLTIYRRFTTSTQEVMLNK